jgi:transposase-like protein
MAEVETKFGQPIEEVIENLFAQCKSQSEVARELGISQPTLSVWLLKLGYKQVSTVSIKKVSA